MTSGGSSEEAAWFISCKRREDLIIDWLQYVQYLLIGCHSALLDSLEELGGAETGIPHPGLHAAQCRSAPV